MQNAVNLGLVQELRMFGLDRFEFNGHFFSCRHVGAKINVTKGTRANLAAEPVFLADAELHGRDAAVVGDTTSVLVARWRRLWNLVGMYVCLTNIERWM